MSTKNWCFLFLFWFHCSEVLVCLGYEESSAHNLTYILGRGNLNYFADSSRAPGRAVPLSEGSRYLRRKWGPRKKQRNREYLLRLMGDSYKPAWMSEKRPKKFRKHVSLSELNLDVSRYVSGTSRQQLHWNQLNLTEELAFFHPELLPRKDQIKSWLIRRASCPVTFTWQDMGADIWPRWLRYGYCLDRNGECSFPAGMTCRPVQGAKVDLHVLRWVCRNRREDTLYRSRKERKGNLASKKNRKACDWVKVITSVIVDCQCEC